MGQSHHHRSLAEVRGQIGAVRGELDELQAAMGALQQRLAVLETVAAYHEQAIGREAAPAPDGGEDDGREADQDGVHDAAGKESNRDLAELKRDEAVEIIMREAEGPLRAATIASRMVARGFPATAKLRNDVFMLLRRRTELYESVKLANQTRWARIRQKGEPFE
jgi:hypothetical protein